MLVVGFSILTIRQHQAKLAGPVVIDRKDLEEVGGLFVGALLSAVYGAFVGGVIFGVRAFSNRPANLESIFSEDESSHQID